MKTLADHSGSFRALERKNLVYEGEDLVVISTTEPQRFCRSGKQGGSITARRPDGRLVMFCRCCVGQWRCNKKVGIKHPSETCPNIDPREVVIKP